MALTVGRALLILLKIGAAHGGGIAWRWALKRAAGGRVGRLMALIEAMTAAAAQFARAPELFLAPADGTATDPRDLSFARLLFNILCGALTLPLAWTAASHQPSEKTANSNEGKAARQGGSTETAALPIDRLLTWWQSSRFRSFCRLSFAFSRGGARNPFFLCVAFAHSLFCIGAVAFSAARLPLFIVIPSLLAVISAVYLLISARAHFFKRPTETAAAAAAFYEKFVKPFAVEIVFLILLFIAATAVGARSPTNEMRGEEFSCALLCSSRGLAMWTVVCIRPLPVLWGEGSWRSLRGK